MFKLKNLPIVALFLFLFFACKQQTLLTYNSVNSTNNIYFCDSNGSEQLDTAFVSFAYSASSVHDSTIGITLRVTGVASPYNRTYGIAVDPASTAVAGTDFVLPDSFVFRAGLYQDTLFVKFLRATELQDTTHYLVLDLKATPDFSINIPFLYDALGDTVSATSFKIGVNDILTAGAYWGDIFQAYFGTFSVKKVELMNQIVGMPLNFWTNLNNLDLGPQAIYYAITFAKYLNAQAAAGDTVYEADGVTPMMMAAAYQ